MQLYACNFVFFLVSLIIDFKCKCKIMWQLCQQWSNIRIITKPLNVACQSRKRQTLQNMNQNQSWRAMQPANCPNPSKNQEANYKNKKAKLTKWQSQKNNQSRPRHQQPNPQKSKEKNAQIKKKKKVNTKTH